MCEYFLHSIMYQELHGESCTKSVLSGSPSQWPQFIYNPTWTGLGSCFRWLPTCSSFTIYEKWGPSGVHIVTALYELSFNQNQKRGQKQ